MDDEPAGAPRKGQRPSILAKKMTTRGRAERRSAR
jgi:hypothetical protein